MKLGQFEEAKLDCDQALQIDGGNVKASYRLALAQKGLEVRASLPLCVNFILEQMERYPECKCQDYEFTARLNLVDTDLLGNLGAGFQLSPSSRWIEQFFSPRPAGLQSTGSIGYSFPALLSGGIRECSL